MRHVLLLALCAACSTPGEPRYEFVPEMVDSVAYDPLAPNPVTRDGRTFQAAPPGAIARGETPFPYGPGPEEALRAGRELANPLTPSDAALARGEAVFRRACVPCHGATGAGDGPLVPRFPGPPALYADHARKLPDGQIVHVIMRGQGLMPSHATQVAPADRWKVVLYLRKLQQPEREVQP